jgi:hypothetical protein
MNLALDDDAVARVVAVVAMHEHGEDGRDEEEDNVPGKVVSDMLQAKKAVTASE